MDSLFLQQRQDRCQTPLLLLTRFAIGRYSGLAAQHRKHRRWRSVCRHRLRVGSFRCTLNNQIPILISIKWPQKKVSPELSQKNPSSRLAPRRSWPRQSSCEASRATRTGLLSKPINISCGFMTYLTFFNSDCQYHYCYSRFGIINHCCFCCYHCFSYIL